MRRRCEVSVRSELGAPPEVVWARVVTPEGINAELRPLLRMTVPRGAEGFGIEEVEPPQRLGRSWLLLLGVLPIDYDDIGLERVEVGRGFLERSTMLSMRLWEHERTLEPLGEGGCAVTDRLAWEPRLPLPGLAFRPLVRAIFRHRHRQLRGHFGPESANQPA